MRRNHSRLNLISGEKNRLCGLATCMDQRTHRDPNPSDEGSEQRDHAYEASWAEPISTKKNFSEMKSRSARTTEHFYKRST
jgi:hypothetical protein